MVNLVAAAYLYCVVYHVVFMQRPPDDVDGRNHRILLEFIWASSCFIRTGVTN